MDRQSGDSPPGFQKLTLVIVMIGLVISSFSVYVWNPIRSRIETANGDIQKAAQEIGDYIALNRERHRLQAKIKELEWQVHGEIPNIQHELVKAGLRNRITGIARNHQVEINSWQPEDFVERPRDGIERKTIRVQMQGGYHQVAHVFSRVLHLPEVFGISQFTIEVTGDQFQEFLLETSFFITVLTPSLAGEGSNGGQSHFIEDSAD